MAISAASLPILGTSMYRAWGLGCFVGLRVQNLGFLPKAETGSGFGFGFRVQGSEFLGTWGLGFFNQNVDPGSGVVRKFLYTHLPVPAAPNERRVLRWLHYGPCSSHLWGVAG